MRSRKLMVTGGAQTKIAVYADSECALAPLDVHRELKKSGRITVSGSAVDMAHPEMQGQTQLDCLRWLPFAASVYKISPKLEDYLVVPVIIMPSDLSNRNCVGFPLRELLRFNADVGDCAYKTWKGQPTHLEHDNEDVTKAYGVIFDSFLRPMSSHGQGKVWKLLQLLAFDRTKHPELTSQIERGERNSYSMGAFVDAYTCSYCGADLGKCMHLDPKAKAPEFYLRDGVLVHKNVRGIKGFETSNVGDPAYYSAISDTVTVVS